MVITLALACAATPAFAGPPYLTDDPIPTDTGHWEIYAFTQGERLESVLDADAGADLNFGPMKGVQLTSTLPLSFSDAPGESWRSGVGDVEIGIKYRFFENEAAGLSAAIFPRVILPTSSLEDGGKTRLLLPLWLGKDFPGGTSLFGGGGYLIDPQEGHRDFWQAGLALTHDFSDQVSLGVEITQQGAETVGATAQTRAGIGAIFKLSEHASLLFSGGPTWAEHHTGIHLYGALGWNK